MQLSVAIVLQWLYCPVHQMVKLSSSATQYKLLIKLRVNRNYSYYSSQQPKVYCQTFNFVADCSVLWVLQDMITVVCYALSAQFKVFWQLNMWQGTWMHAELSYQTSLFQSETFQVQQKNWLQFDSHILCLTYADLVLLVLLHGCPSSHRLSSSAL